MKRLLFIACTIFLFASSLLAQEAATDSVQVPMRRQLFVIVDSDTIPLFGLRPVHIFSTRKFKSQKERLEYTKLVRDVRKTHPYARMIANSIIETYQYMETLPDEKAKQKHLEEVQKYMMDEYKPHLMKMTKNQGKILIKLIDRECNTSSYTIVKSLLGDLRAGVYNTFAGLFGNSLKTKYDPEGADAEIETIVIQLEEGSLDYYMASSFYFGQ
ncbi:DUF4294 domain-containing protein [Dysgonomonas sp. 25]|uniref:DUF4294 domain-containing protein n=1 Tax=Dysgonomonas sp. 25 TaxID=2302933 RepID=UPI0013D3DB3B|nr:DUF4294 domain-containing protein [Dysgonomonas sp. 25]NDV69617.1 DUF4294 domain-containing protein [Dysgonomonas sp. 25]